MGLLPSSVFSVRSPDGLQPLGAIAASLAETLPEEDESRFEEVLPEWRRVAELAPMLRST